MGWLLRKHCKKQQPCFKRDFGWGWPCFQLRLWETLTSFLAEAGKGYCTPRPHCGFLLSDWAIWGGVCVCVASLGEFPVLGFNRVTGWFPCRTSRP